MGSAASLTNNHEEDTISWLTALSTNERVNIANLPSQKLLSFAQSIEKHRSNRHTWIKVRSLAALPNTCACCTSTERFFTLGDLHFHFKDNHLCSYFKLLDFDPNPSTLALSSNTPHPLHRSLQFLSPADLIDVSTACSWLFVACESSWLWSPWGKGTFSRIYKTYVKSSRASSIVKVTDIVMKASQKKLTLERRNLTSLVEGNRIELLKVHTPNATQYTTASAILALLLLPNEKNCPSPDDDSFRRLLNYMLAFGVQVPTIENKLQTLNVCTVPSASMLRARPHIETLRKDLQIYDGLNPFKYRQEHRTAPTRLIDQWTKVVANYLIAFNAKWHGNMFYLAAKQSLTGTMSALKQSKHLLHRLEEEAPVFMKLVVDMQGNSLHRQRRDPENNEEGNLKRVKDKKDQVDRLGK